MKKQMAVEWLISQINTTSCSISSNVSVKIDINKEIVEEAIRLEKHGNMNEWHEGYEEGRAAKVQDGESGVQIKAVSFLVSELLNKIGDMWFLNREVNVDEIIERAKEIEQVNNELAYKKGASDELAFLNHAAKSEKQKQ